MNCSTSLETSPRSKEKTLQIIFSFMFGVWASEIVGLLYLLGSLVVSAKLSELAKPPIGAGWIVW